MPIQTCLIEEIDDFNVVSSEAENYNSSSPFTWPHNYYKQLNISWTTNSVLSQL